MSDIKRSEIYVNKPRPRVAAAVLHADGQAVLMVQHRRLDGTTYWQLPGGGVEPGERLESAVLRELYEETGLNGQVERFLFAIPYKYGTSTTFLVTVAADAQPMLGYDPEEVDAQHRKLVAVAWQRFQDQPGNPEIEQLVRTFDR